MLGLCVDCSLMDDVDSLVASAVKTILLNACRQSTRQLPVGLPRDDCADRTGQQMCDEQVPGLGRIECNAANGGLSGRWARCSAWAC